MTTNTTSPGLDFSGFDLSKTDALRIRRQAEIERTEDMRKAFGLLGTRISTVFRSAGDLFRFTQRMNQAARL